MQGLAALLTANGVKSGTRCCYIFTWKYCRFGGREASCRLLHIWGGGSGTGEGFLSS